VVCRQGAEYCPLHGFAVADRHAQRVGREGAAAGSAFDRGAQPRVARAATGDDGIVDTVRAECVADGGADGLGGGGEEVIRAERWSVAIDPGEELVAGAEAAAVGARREECGERNARGGIGCATRGGGAVGVVVATERRACGAVKQLVARAEVGAADVGDLVRVCAAVVRRKDRGVRESAEVEDGARARGAARRGAPPRLAGTAS
jgi:hypothetical protein